MTAQADLHRLDHLDLARFQQHLGQSFDCIDEHGTCVTLALVTAEDVGSTPRQEQFSLIFHGPQSPGLQQGLHRMSHPEVGAFLLFLVPLQPTADARPYQAVFNRLRP